MESGDERRREHRRRRTPSTTSGCGCRSSRRRESSVAADICKFCFISERYTPVRLSRRARSLARSRPRSLDRPRCRECRDDFGGQFVAGLCFVQSSTSLRQRLHARRACHAVTQRILVRQRPVRAEPFTELVTQVLPVFWLHRHPGFVAFRTRPHAKRCACHGPSVNVHREGFLRFA
jgi:hypothetical protein